ncbi:unnamed protein product [Tuber aestivum]|uniref:Uncharacterized protein n=1 Tax=Tuber aestivum TaxID=59557 RepID=A0A292PWN7_9PEZI|nr:unnamed protein product [Tuber aestivum]
METLPVDQEDPTCDAILLTESTMGSVDDRKIYSYHELKQILEEEELEVHEAIGELYVGNPRGLGRAGIPERLRIVEEDVHTVKEPNAENKAKIAERKDSVSILGIEGPDYKRVRDRFLSIFKSDKMEETLNKSDQNFIAGGNVIAHWGDAAIEALVYDGAGRRQDQYVFEELYGLHPSDVQKNTYKETIEVFNRHARVKANDPPAAAAEFYRRFSVFLAALTREDPGSNYLSYDHTNPTWAAYWCLHGLEI